MFIGRALDLCCMVDLPGCYLSLTLAFSDFLFPHVLLQADGGADVRPTLVGPACSQGAQRALVQKGELLSGRKRHCMVWPM